jgi:hypothetical protein
VPATCLESREAFTDAPCMVFKHMQFKTGWTKKKIKEEQVGNFKINGK